MKPTEQDKELRKKIEKIPIAYSSDQGGEAMYFEDFGIMPSDIDDFYDELIKLITADRERVALEARIDELPFLKGMKETSASLLEDGSGDFVRVQDLDTRLGDWINELEMLTQQRKEK